LEYGIQTDEILNKKQKNYTAFKFFVSNSKWKKEILKYDKVWKLIIGNWRRSELIWSLKFHFLYILISMNVHKYFLKIY
jgi:hypothetical protein